ncbi:uroporphyrinogen-III synthase [Pseudidiomarina homiensis]|uniref:uroporphyrinogen-III synthase n=1 Tax=Pseudidiomarina homiensis TaxID=364198 RepID=UPI00215B34DB|nr:uroporphyrinogen-III synthase [Pseudidiomarina homiensis]
MKHILILRPEAQAAELQQLLQQRAAEQGYDIRSSSASMLEIKGYDDPSRSLADTLRSAWDGAMMVSVNAAHYFAQQAQAWAPDQDMPRCRWFAVGPVSAEAIARVVHRPVVCPWREHNSDALLALPELQQVNGQRWLIVRGRSGRELFADTLRARGAEVHYLEVYERITKTPSDQQLRTWQQSIDTIMVSSAEQLGAFLAAVPKDAIAWLARCTWIVASHRLQQLLPAGIGRHVMIADSAASFAMVDAWQRAMHVEKDNL